MVRNNQNNRAVIVTPAMEDSSSPYYLHNGDHPGLSLVSNPLTGSNYHGWSRAIVTALTAKNKTSFIDGTLPRPAPDDLLFNAWTRCNSMVISWLLNAVSKDIATSLLYFGTAAEIWIDLQERFQQSKGPRIFQIKKQLMVLQQGTMDVNCYYTKLKSLWDELKGYQPVPICNCGGIKPWLDSQHMDYVMQFLMGLNESFSQVRAQILLMDPLPSISKVFSLVIQEERQRMINNSFISSELGLSSDLNASMANAANVGSKFKKDRPTCTHCGLHNHTIDKCYKIHGYPPGYKGRNASGFGTHGRNSNARAQANQVTSSMEKGSSDKVEYGDKSEHKGLTTEQCQQLIVFLSTQLQHSNLPSLDVQPTPSISSFSGPYTGPSDWDG